MKLIVDKDIQKVHIIIDDASTTDEMTLHVEQSADIVIINVEDVERA